MAKKPNKGAALSATFHRVVVHSTSQIGPRRQRALLEDVFNSNPLGGSMRNIVLLVTALAALVLCARTTTARQATQPSPGDGLDRLAWMVGSWAADGGGTYVEEHWTPARGNTMLAVARTTRGPRTVFYEFLRIEQTGDAITYHGAPKGRHPATPFQMTEVSADKVVFENPQHDFPQRITYWRDGPDGMGAKVEGKDGKGAQSWVFKRVKT
jgi:hypothetical protein